MHSIGEIISKYRKKKHLSQIDLATALHMQYGYEVSNKSISKWETDKAEPSLRVFFDICRLIGATDLYCDYFGENPDDPLSALNELGKERVYEYAALLQLDPRYQKLPASEPLAFRSIPLQLYPVSAGPGNFLDEENYEEMQVGPEVPSSADFAVRVSGDSMEPLLHKNQIIYIHKQNTLENGEIGIFFLNGEAFVKKFQKTASKTALLSLNKNYAPLPISAESDFRIFGKMVYQDP